MKMCNRKSLFLSSSMLLASTSPASCFSSAGTKRARASMPSQRKQLVSHPPNDPNCLTLLSESALEFDTIPPIPPLTEQANATAASTTTEPIPFPDAKRVLAFAIPAIGVWLCSPLLSLIDTSTVGLFAGTAQQAALNPAVAVTDYSARLLSFLFTGTTNMVAIAQETDRGVADKPDTARTFRGALQLSVLVGAGLGAFLFVFAKPMLLRLIGNDALDPQVFAAAMKYVRIRALGMPAAAAIGTAQAACLGMQDIHSPLYVIAVAAVVNLVMDLLLVGNPQPWIGGAAGAAWATMFSQYFAIGLFFKWLSTKPKSTVSPVTVQPDQPASRLATMPLFRRRRSNKNKPKDLVSTRGFLAGRLHWKDFFQRPDPTTTNGFRPYVLPVTTTQVGRCSAYVAMGHTVSSSFGTISMAANQIITSIFYSLIPIADSLSLTAQSFLPGIVARKPSHERAKAIRGTTLSLLKVAGLFGIFLAGVVACIPVAAQLFSTDPAVTSLVRRMVPVLLCIFSLHGVFCGSEGILLGQGDLGFLGRMYAVYFAVVPYLMLRVKHAAKAGAAVDLATVWNIFLGYQLFRITAWVGRVLWLQRRTNREAIESIQGAI